MHPVARRAGRRAASAVPPMLAAAGLLLGALLAVVPSSLLGADAALAAAPTPAPTPPLDPGSTATPAALGPIRSPFWAVEGSSGARLTWLAPASDGLADSVLTYAVVVDAAPGGRTTRTTTGTSLVLDPVARGAALTATVTTTALGGASSTTAVPVWTPPTAAAGPPRDVALRASAAGDERTLRLTWSAPAAGSAPVTGYLVRVRRSGAALSAGERRTASTARSTTFDALEPNTGYVASVAALTAGGEGPRAFSDTVDTAAPAGDGAVAVAPAQADPVEQAPSAPTPAEGAAAPAPQVVAQQIARVDAVSTVPAASRGLLLVALVAGSAAVLLVGSGTVLLLRRRLPRPIG